MDINHRESVNIYARQISRTLHWNIAINIGYCMVNFTLLSISFLNNIIGSQIVNPDQESRSLGYLFCGLTAGTAALINASKRLNQAKKVSRLKIKLLQRMTMDYKHRKK